MRLVPWTMGLALGIAASLVSMTVNEDGKDETREFFIRRSDGYEPRWKPITFSTRAFRVGYDVTREPLGFDVKLEDKDIIQYREWRRKRDVVYGKPGVGAVRKPEANGSDDPASHDSYLAKALEHIRDAVA